MFTLHADFNAAKDVFTDTIERLRSAVDSTAGVVLAFSCPTRRYFRHNLLPTYKGNRAGHGPPLCYGDLKQWAADEYKSFIKPQLEADDVVGILATSQKLIKGERVVVSNDKDLQQIPGLHLDPTAPHEGVFRISTEHAERKLWEQVLTGDSVDNYSGLPGCGPVKAAKILDGAEDYEEACLKAYLKAGLTAEDMVRMVNVARILHVHHYNFKKKEPILYAID